MRHYKIESDSWRFDGYFLTGPDHRKRPALSGPYGRGKLPEGFYLIGRAVVIDPDDPANRPYRDRSGLAWWCPLTPLFETDRDSFGIHPDGNIPGTMGCIGITDSETGEILDLLKKSEGEQLSVDYSGSSNRRAPGGDRD